MIKYLIDTHILIFYFFQKSNLSSEQLKAIENDQSEIFVSEISFFEIATLIRLSKIDLGITICDLYHQVEQCGFKISKIRADELDMLSAIIPIKGHKDPVDLYLICQTVTNEFQIITNDRSILNYFENKE